MESSGDRLAYLSRTMDDINQMELEEMARGAGLRPQPDQQLHLNMLRRKIQQQRSMVSKLSRDDLENQYLHMLEELDILKKDSNTKDQYIKRLSTKVLRLQRNESLHREDGRSLNGSLRLEMEQKIRSLENQLKMTKVYGSSLPARKASKSDTSSFNKSQTDVLRQQIQSLEVERRDEQAAHQRMVGDLEAELTRALEKQSTADARTTMLENMEVTRLTKQLVKSQQDMLNIKNDYNEIKPKYEELQINKIIVTRENENLKREIDRRTHDVDGLETQLREAKEKSTSKVQDQERTVRLEHEVEWLRRQQLAARGAEPAPAESPGLRIAEDVLRGQIKTLEEELQRENEECQELRKRLTIRETDIERTLRDVSDLRNANVLLINERDALKSRAENSEPVVVQREVGEGWFQAPPGYRLPDFEHAIYLKEAFQLRRDFSATTEPVPLERSSPGTRNSSQALEEVERLQTDLERLGNELRRTRADLSEAREAISSAHSQNQKLQYEIRSGSQNMQKEFQEAHEKLQQELRRLQEKLEERSRALAEKSRLVDQLERQLREIAEATIVYNLEDDIADQSRLSADNVVLQHGDNLLQIHFGPFAFNEEFFSQAEALRITKWRIKWSVFGESMFAQDSEKKRPDFDFTAIHCITMDEQIMTEISEGFIRIEVVGIRGDFSRAFAFATFSCRKLLSDSHQHLNRVRGEVPLISQFNVSDEFGIMVYWMRMKFDVQQTQAMYLARQKSLDYVEENTNRRNEMPTADQTWMQQNGPEANLLHVRIQSCSSVRALAGPGPPSLCVIYQFYNSKTTYTPAVIASENPEFAHQSTFRVMENENLHHYLLNEKLELYVMDTNDHNDNHYLGTCLVDLAELVDNPLRDRRIKLSASSNQSNGTILISIFFERPYRRQRNAIEYPLSQRSSDTARLNRASLTPRGSLVSITHDSKLLKVKKAIDLSPNNPHRYTESARQNDRGDGVDQVRNRPADGPRPQPPPRKKYSGQNDRRELDAGFVQTDSKKGSNYFSPPSTSNYKGINSYNKPARRDDVQRSDQVPHNPLRSTNDRDGGLPMRRPERSRTVEERRSLRESRPVHSLDRTSSLRGTSASTQQEAVNSTRSRTTVGKSLRSRTKEQNDVASPRRRQQAPDQLNLSHQRNGGIPSDEDNTGLTPRSRRSTSMPNGTVQTVRAELHENEDDTKRRNSVVISHRKTSNPSVPGRTGGLDLLSPRAPPPSTVVIVVHSLHFTENSPVFDDDRPGEIFVVFDFLGTEHESPLAVVKPNAASVELIFEFQKHRDQAQERQMLLSMLQSTPPGRIPFSVYFQPDDENLDCELLAVAALSLNRLLTKQQDAVGAELKLISPTERGVIVGYIRVTVQAVDVLLRISSDQDQRS